MRLVDSTVHSLTRANPCMGKLGSAAFGPNQGQQIGTPPRIGLSALNALAELIHSTGFCPAGWKCVTCAPCRYTSASPALVLIETLVSPPLPSLNWISSEPNCF